jgi:hypothetical protein
MRQASKRIPGERGEDGPGCSQSHTSASFSGREDPHRAGGPSRSAGPLWRKSMANVATALRPTNFKHKHV